MSVEQRSGTYAVSANCCCYSDASRLIHKWVSAFILHKIWSFFEIMGIMMLVKEANCV